MPMPAMPVRAQTREQGVLPLVLTARPVELGERRLVLCTLVKNALIAFLATL